MTTKTPLPIPAYLFLAASLFALTIISRNTSYANNAAPVTVSANTPTRTETATPTATNTATPTRSPTPSPSGRASPPDEAMLGRLDPELGTRAEIALAKDALPPTPTLSHSIQPTPLPDTTWPPSPVGKALVVDQDAQVLRVYEDGVEVRALPASTGAPPLYTPAFLGHIGRYASTIYGYGALADNAWYVLTARGNIYIHGAPYTLSEGVKVYKEEIKSLGVRPSSHGCIRLHPADAEWLTAWNPRGAPILITPLDLNRKW
ncbi:MAG: L,D-transpeptidase [Chloroflexota bacterium]|nr:L,D-transpeptidase [Chloroflexota bacterium]